MASGTNAINLQQVVEGQLRVYKRPLNSASGSAVKSFAHHEAAVVQTQNGNLYLIEIGVDPNDDINFTEVYREGCARVALVKENQLQQWQFIKSATVTRSGVTLDQLLQACNQCDYSVLGYNCWNAVEKMIKCIDAANSDWRWQEKVAAGTAGATGVALAAAAIIGIGAALVKGLSNDKEKDKAYM